MARTFNPLTTPVLFTHPLLLPASPWALLLVTHTLFLGSLCMQYVFSTLHLCVAPIILSRLLTSQWPLLWASARTRSGLPRRFLEGKGTLHSASCTDEGAEIRLMTEIYFSVFWSLSMTLRRSVTQVWWRSRVFFPFTDASLRFYFLHLELLYLCTLETKRKKTQGHAGFFSCAAGLPFTVGVWGCTSHTVHL